jgi:ABC-type transport system involved in Fe-S cluster assembly fused permease/ATPase subunit
VTISQLLISYYDSNKELIWVDHQFVKEGVRQQKKQFFNYTIMSMDEIQTVLNSTENCIINGIENEEVGEKFIPARILNHHHKDLQPIPEGFVKIELNNFIGNPN